MQLIYEGKDITSAVEIVKAEITDNAGGIADNIELVFSDTEGLWSRWKPRKNHILEVKQDGFSSGRMYIDTLEQHRGRFLLKALSIPQAAKTQRTKTWENIRFLALATEMAGRYGFKLKTYGVQNWLYQQVDQVEQKDFEFLAYQSLLEGYTLKLTDQTVIIYDKAYLQSQPVQRIIYKENLLGEYCFKQISTGIYRSCHMKWNSSDGMVQAEYMPSDSPEGPILKMNLPAGSQGEALRNARGLLLQANRKESTGSVQLKLDTGLAAGSILEVSGIGLADGKYFIEQAIHRLTEGRTLLHMYKALEGYS